MDPFRLQRIIFVVCYFGVYWFTFHYFEVFELAVVNKIEAQMSFPILQEKTGQDLLKSLGYLMQSTLFVFTLWIGVFLPKFMQAFALKKYFKLSNILIFVLMSIWIAFSWVGNHLFLKFPEVDVTLTSVLAFLSFVLWLMPLEMTFIIYLQYLQKKLYPHPLASKKISPRALWLITFSIMNIVWGGYLMGLNPSHMTLDSMVQWEQIMGLRAYADWHPIFHTLWMQAITSVLAAPWAVSAVQIVWMSSLISTMLVWLYKEGIPYKALILFTFIFALLPNNGIYMVSLWKDIPYTIALLWLTFLFVQIARDKEGFRINKSFVIQLVICLVFIYFFRHNGFIPCIAALLGLGVLALKQKHRPLLISIVTSVLLILSIQFLLKYQLSYVENPKGIRYLSMTHGIAAAYIQDEKISPKAKVFFEDVMPKNDWKHLFYPYSINPYMFDNPYALIDKLSKLPTQDILQMYLYSFKESPYLLIKDRFNGTDLLWNVTQDDDAYNYRYSETLEKNRLGLQRQENMLTQFIFEYTKPFAVLKITDLLIWRVGFFLNLLLCLCFYWWITHAVKNFFIVIPLFSNAFSLILSMGWQDYRYVYFTFVLFWLIFAYGLLPTKEMKLKTPAN